MVIHYHGLTQDWHVGGCEEQTKSQAYIIYSMRFFATTAIILHRTNQRDAQAGAEPPDHHADEVRRHAEAVRDNPGLPPMQQQPLHAKNNMPLTLSRPKFDVA